MSAKSSFRIRVKDYRAIDFLNAATMWVFALGLTMTLAGLPALERRRFLAHAGGCEFCYVMGGSVVTGSMGGMAPPYFSSPPE